jgi:hypothetical protein
MAVVLFRGSDFGQKARRRDMSGTETRAAVLAAVLFTAAILTAMNTKTANGQQAAQGSIISSAEPAAVGEDAQSLKRDTGRVGGKQSLPGSGHSVKFALPTGQWYLIGVDFQATRYGQGAGGAQWQLAACDAGNRTLGSILEPYGAIETGEPRWYRVNLPALALPMSDKPQQPANVHINLAFDSNKSRGVEVGHDVAKKETSSGVGMPDKPLQKTPQVFDWMIRAVITQKPPKGSGQYGTWTGGLEELAYDAGVMDGAWENQGAGPAVRFTEVPAGSTIEGFSVYAIRPTNVDPTRRKADYWVTNESGDVIASGSVPYTGFPTEGAWVDIALKTKAPAPPVFYFMINGNSDARGGINIGHDRKTQKSAHAKLGSAPGKYKDVGEFRDWMIRAYVRKPAPVPKEESVGAPEAEGAAAAQ